MGDRLAVRWLNFGSTGPVQVDMRGGNPKLSVRCRGSDPAGLQMVTVTSELTYLCEVRSKDGTGDKTICFGHQRFATREGGGGAGAGSLPASVDVSASMSPGPLVQPGQPCPGENLRCRAPLPTEELVTVRADQAQFSCTARGQSGAEVSATLGFSWSVGLPQ